MAHLAKNPEVVCTELEDGAILLNLETRLYYSLNDVALEIWRQVGAADGNGAVAQEISRRFDVAEEEAGSAVSRFVAELERERLVVAADAAPVSETALPREADGSRKAFAEPELIQHDEPLHEVTVSPFDPQLPLAE